ncbi:uncharacterized protein LOC106653540 [Trichogramma pretiosum]|uniref:uncharacterized protein LOC106653540 n=1 Tax=Trichogramma pretiosum TaxID=7493 RepID=UPI0006C9D2E6|nr:uncharacterized protein LOC106653540 [Trichogramma pretiosum]
MDALVDKQIKKDMFWSRFFLQSACLWPYTNRILKYAGRVLLIPSAIFMELCLLYGGYKNLRQDSLDIVYTFTNVIELLIGISIIPMYFITMSYDREFKLLLGDMMHFYSEEASAEERKIVQDVTRGTYHLSCLLAAFVCVFCAAYALAPHSVWYHCAPVLLVPLLRHCLGHYRHHGNHSSGSSRALASTAVVFAVDQDKYYYPLFVYTTMNMIQLATVANALSASFLCSVAFIRAQFRIIVHRLTNLDSLVQREYLKRDLSIQDYIHQEFINLYLYHINSIRNLKLINMIGEKLLFIVSVLCLLGLSFSGSMAVIFLRKAPLAALNFVMCFIVLLILSLMLNYVGQSVIDANNEVYHNCYHCGWYGFPVKTRPFVFLMLMITRKACGLKSGPFTILQLSYENYSLILKSVISYITVMISVL